MRCSLLLVLACLFAKNIFAQVIVSGVVKGENEILENANIIAKPLTEGARFTYTVTDDKGNYKLSLTKNATYKITVSFIGYITLKEDVLVANMPITKDFILKEDPNELQEVIINYREPIKIRKDTTTYRADAFVNGKERKLRQVLKKLPGVEVDRKGNVTVKGKKVTTVLVENKKFFTGDSKLAVNNIPADVIDEIQVIEDYHESDLLKGLETSEDIALNINLKEDKKKFAFGDIEVGGGVKERYVVHPTLFRYSEKINYSFIGDFNNVGDKSFTVKDYITYEGAFDINSFSSLYNSPIVRLLRDKKYNENKHLFGGLNLQFSTSEKNDWSAFVIALKDNTNSVEGSYQNYLVDTIEETRRIYDDKRQNMLLGKIELKSKPNEDVRIKFENKVEISSANNKSETESNFNSEDLLYNLNDKVDNVSLKSNLKIEKKSSRDHTSQAKINLVFSKNNENQNWFSTQDIFSNSLPIDQAEEHIFVRQKINSENYQAKTLLKHFWIVNPRNHLYFGVKNELYFNTYNSNLGQLIGNDELDKFDDFDSENSNKEVFSSFFAEYKKLIGDAFLTFKLEYLNYNRFNKQFELEKNRTFQKLLPSVNLEWDFDANKKLVFYYRKTNDVPSYNQLNRNKKLINFNSIYQGNINLTESSYHYFRLSYRRFKTYGWSFYPTVSYRLRTNKIQNTFISDNIYFYNSPINITTPEKGLSLDFKTIYNYKYWRASLGVNYGDRSYITLFNQREEKANDDSYSARLKFKSVYINGPNFDVSLSQNYNVNKNSFISDNTSYRTKFDFQVDYEIGDWIFIGENLYSYYQNETSKTKNSFNQMNTSIFYQKEDSPWGFEIKANNLLDNKERVTSSLSDILFSERTELVFPRTIVFKIVYKI
ncbi:outer membrane beta-barrel protein [Tenacibaculum gallaicum]|uniref:Outer membrane beta-barrel protein n=1 Tax=Tenacibaculum gallaicum TaxID=561505 RepID=A0A3E0HVT7_9FLAO|nr:TonB-dependent receptor [Tenacibaculum gallaicum]REH50577.1 outer membrane beta-barrel protein [Tenacibaculum gallaicum]